MKIDLLLFFSAIFVIAKKLTSTLTFSFLSFLALLRVSLFLDCLRAREKQTHARSKKTMSDVKDILGVGRGGGGAGPPALPPSSIAAAAAPAAAAAAALGNRQPREVRPPRPAGMSREAYALLDG